MPKIILHDRIVEDDWQVVQFPIKQEPVRKQAGKLVIFRITGEQAISADEVAALQIPSGKVIVPLAAWLGRKQELAPRLSAGQLGVWLDSYELLENLLGSIDDINKFGVIAVNFPRFVDGRGFSMATLLRTRHGYRGELRAIGDVLQDQLFYMRRVGFNAYAIRADKSIESALRGLTDFSETYQSAVDEPLPLFRRHSRSPAP